MKGAKNKKRMEYVYEQKITAVKKRKKPPKEILEFIILVLPTFLLITLFTFFPFFKTLYTSFWATDFSGNPKRFVGITYYVELLNSQDFINSFIVTLKYVGFNTIFSIIGGLILALIVDNSKIFAKLFKVLYTFPISLSSASCAIVWGILLNPSVSIINYLVERMGLGKIEWLTDPKLALLSIVLINCWQNIPFNFIFLLAGLQNIPYELYEVSNIDGANFLYKVWKIILPLLTPTLFFVLVINIIDSFQQFTIVHILTSGGPVNSTKLLVYSIYQDAFFNFKFGRACAESIVLFVILFILTVFQFKVVEKKVFYQ